MLISSKSKLNCLVLKVPHPYALVRAAGDEAHPVGTEDEGEDGGVGAGEASRLLQSS